MGWRPLIVEPGERARIEAVIAELVPRAPATTVNEAIGEALVRAYLAELVPDRDDASGTALAAAVSLATAGTSPALFGGAAGAGWAVAHLADGDAADAACAAIDDALARLLDAGWTGDHDLVSGLTGFAVYALERGEPARALAQRILGELARSARPVGGGLAWHTAPALLAPADRAEAPDGCWNLGMAHGTPGTIAVLARFHDAPGAYELLAGAVAYLLAAEPARPDGRYPAWHPESGDRARLAWCYGDLGVSLALLAAADACGRADWRAEALALAHGCARRDAISDGVALCHGAAGIAHLFTRLWNATGDDELAGAAGRWIARALALPRDGLDGTVLNGTAGLALALHAMISTVEPGWGRLLAI